MQGRLPAAILRKKKHGFRIPLAEWLKNELKEPVFDLLLGKKAEERGYFSRAYVQKLLENYRVDMKYSYKIWELFALESWLRKHFP